MEKLRVRLRKTVENFWNFWNKEIQFEFLFLLERKRKVLKFFKYFGNYWKNWEHSMENFWNFWKRPTLSSSRRLKFLNCILKIIVLLEKLRARLKFVWEIFGIFGIKISTLSSFLCWKEKKRSLKFWNCILEIVYYWKNWEHGWNFWNWQAQNSSSSPCWKEKERFWNFLNSILEIVYYWEKFLKFLE